jgi:hypothetical protein
MTKVAIALRLQCQVDGSIIARPDLTDAAVDLKRFRRRFLGLAEGQSDGGPAARRTRLSTIMPASSRAGSGFADFRHT